MARIPEGIVLIADEEDVKPTIIELEAAVAAGLYNPDIATTKSNDVMILDPVSKKWTPRRPSVHIPFMPRKTDWDLARSRKLAKAKAVAAKKATHAEAASPKPTRHVSTRHRVTTPAEAESSAPGAGHELAQVTSATLVAPMLTTTQSPRLEPSKLTDSEMSDEPTELALSPPASQQAFSISSTPTDLQTQMQHLQLSNQAKDQELARTRAFLYWQMQIQQQTQSQSQLEQQLLRAQIHDLQQRQRHATAGPVWTPFFQQQPAHQRIETARPQSPIKMDPADWSAIYKAARLQES